MQTPFFWEFFLYPFISLSVGIILFEGSLSLKLKEVKEVISVVRRLITICYHQTGKGLLVIS